MVGEDRAETERDTGTRDEEEVGELFYQRKGHSIDIATN